MFQGLLSTFRGVNAIALGAIPAHALYFSVYEKLKLHLTAGRAGHEQTWAYGVAGIAATVVHDAVMNPAEGCSYKLNYKFRLLSSFHGE